MSDYVLTEDGELMHYGVLGMRWGVKRASNRLSKVTTKEQRDKAINKLKKHKSKAETKIAKLDKNLPKLQKKVDRAVIKTDVKEAKLRRQTALYKQKAGMRFISSSRATRYMARAMSMEAKADLLKSSSDIAKTEIKKNRRMKELFQEGISSIDKAILENGKRKLGK